MGMPQSSQTEVQLRFMCLKETLSSILMCRRIIIDCEWDDDSPRDAADVFYHVDKFDTLNPMFEHLLRELITERFMGQITIRVERLHGNLQVQD